MSTKHVRRLAALDFLVIAISYLSAYGLRQIWTGETPPFRYYLLLFPVLPVLWMFLLAALGGYRRPNELTLLRIVRVVVSTTVLGLILLFAIVFIFKLHFVSRIIAFAAGGFAGIGLLAVRIAVAHQFGKSAFRCGEYVLVVGTGSRARRLTRRLLDQSRATRHIVGFVALEAHHVGRRIRGRPVIGAVDQIEEVLRTTVVDEVFLATTPRRFGRIEPVVRACQEEGIRVRTMADFFHISPRHLTLEACSDIPLLSYDPNPLDGWKLQVKRGIDVVVAGVLLVVLAPVLVLVALAVKLDSPGPVFFVQSRIGLHKRRFKFIKFRSMVIDAEQRQPDLEHLNEADGPVFKIRNDPRVTRIGRFLRRTSLDELPQLVHVLTGNMSLVGPRPLPLRDVERFDQGVQRRRFSFKPGVTCLWQVSVRSNLSFAEWLRLDLWYIENWSIMLDLRILFRTIPAVFKRTGAL